MNQKEKYDRLTMPEFMEFLVRCSYLKYEKLTHLTMLEKTERVLDILLKPLDCRRKKPDFEIEVSSESDYNSDD